MCGLVARFGIHQRSQRADVPVHVTERPQQSLGHLVQPHPELEGVANCQLRGSGGRGVHHLPRPQQRRVVVQRVADRQRGRAVAGRRRHGLALLQCRAQWLLGQDVHASAKRRDCLPPTTGRSK